MGELIRRIPLNMERMEEPADMSLSTVPYFDFFLSTRKFLDENFRGLVNTDQNDGRGGYVRIAPKGFAFFIKKLVSGFLQNSVNYAIIARVENELKVQTSFRKGCGNVSKELRGLAERCGFKASFRGGSLLMLSLEVIEPNASLFYSVDSLVFYNNYLEVFM